MSEIVRRPPDDHEAAWQRTFRYLLALFALSLVSLLLLLAALTIWWNGLCTQAEILRMAHSSPPALQPRVAGQQASPLSSNLAPQRRRPPLPKAQAISRSTGARPLRRVAPARRQRGPVIVRELPSTKPRRSHSAVRTPPGSRSTVLRLSSAAGKRAPRARAMGRSKGFPRMARGSVRSIVPIGAVARQKPAPGTLTRRSGLRSRPPTRGRHQVPNLIGLTLRQARARARGSGYWLVFYGTVPHPARRGTVVWQNPPAGLPAPGGRYLGYRMSSGAAS